jgi:hypothetical protein
LVFRVLLLEKKMGTLALFFSGECQAGVGLTTATVSLSREAVDPSRLAAVASMSLGLEYVMIDLRFGKAGGALLRAVASSPWMLKITPSRANTPILISRALTISEATEAE